MSNAAKSSGYPDITPGPAPGSGPDPFFGNVRARGAISRLVAMTPRADVVAYDLKSPRWKAAPLKMAMLSDFHIMKPWTPIKALEQYVDAVNGMGADIIFLLGDYTSAHMTPGFRVSTDETAERLARLDAPLGVHAVLGNHDWIDDPEAPGKRFKTSAISKSLVKAGLRPLINSARRVTHEGQDLWIVGIDSQVAPRDETNEPGRHDSEQAFAEVPDDSLAILLAHEPDYFVFGDHRPVLQLSGHTHGGQASFFGWRPFTPSAFSQRYAYGHVEEGGQHLVVSGGLGYTHVPMRIAVPPEITLVRMSAAD